MTISPHGVRVAKALLYDFTSVEVEIEAEPLLGFKSISYASQRNDGGDGSTHTCSITMYLKEWGNFKARLAERELRTFDLKVSYLDGSETPLTDVLSGCFIDRISQSHLMGSEALVVKVDLKVQWINYGGAKLPDPAYRKDTP